MENELPTRDELQEAILTLRKVSYVYSSLIEDEINDHGKDVLEAREGNAEALLNTTRVILNLSSMADPYF